MGKWSNRINGITTERIGMYDPNYDPDLVNLLFCFSQMDEKSEDWGALTSKADQFIRKDGEIRPENTARIERLLNGWATGTNSPLRGDGSNNPDRLRFSAPSYLFRGYNAMKNYFTSVGVNLEENMPKLSVQTKKCAEKVEAISAMPASRIPSVEGDLKEASALRTYIMDEYETAFCYGLNTNQIKGKKLKFADPYQNESGPAKDVLNRLDEACRGEIGAVYDSIKDSKKWYGKDSAEYTGMMEAVKAYKEASGKEKSQENSAEVKQTLEKAMRECSQYLEKNDGVKFTAVGGKRRDAVKKMLDLMNQLPEAQSIKNKLEAEKQEREAQKAKPEKKAEVKRPEKKKEEPKAKPEKKAEEKKVEEKKAVKPAERVQKQPAAAKPIAPKPAGPVDKDEEWFRMTDYLMKEMKTRAGSSAAPDREFHKMDRVMEQYKGMTAKDQARVRDMWVNKYEMGEDTWKMLKERNGIKEKVSTNFNNLKKVEEKEKPKMSKMSQKAMEKEVKEAVKEKKERSMSF